MSRVAVHFRINEADLKQFRETARKFEREPNDVIRELMKAYGEGRIQITPTTTQQQERSVVYHES